MSKNASSRDRGNDLLEAAIAQKVQVSPWGNLKLRDYQEQAVVAVEEALLRGEREALLAMATGTGKTITVIALMYRLLAANYFNRILFVVDRGVLGKQAQDAFAEVRPEGNLSFEQIYDVKELSDKRPDTPLCQGSCRVKWKWVCSSHPPPVSVANRRGMRRPTLRPTQPSTRMGAGEDTTREVHPHLQKPHGPETGNAPGTECRGTLHRGGRTAADAVALVAGGW